jgi:hypothetical protein
MIPKRRHSKIRRRGYTQKTTYNFEIVSNLSEWNFSPRSKTEIHLPENMLEDTCRLLIKLYMYYVSLSYSLRFITTYDKALQMFNDYDTRKLIFYFICK